MMRNLGRRARLLVLVGTVALVAAGCVDFSGTKVITGEGTPTGDFVVRITCQIGDQTITQDVTFQGEETQSGDPFLLGPFDGTASCTIEEIEQGGATSWFLECGEIDVEPVFPDAALTGSGPGQSVSRRGLQEEVTCTESADGHTLTIEIALEGPAEVEVDYTVTNDFTPVPPTTAAPTTTTTAPAPEAAAAPPVPARVVTFTG